MEQAGMQPKEEIYCPMLLPAIWKSPEATGTACPCGAAIPIPSIQTAPPPITPALQCSSLAWDPRSA